MSQAKKKELKQKQGLNQLLLNKSGLKIDLVEEHEDDIKTAKLLIHNTKKGKFIKCCLYLLLSLSNDMLRTFNFRYSSYSTFKKIGFYCTFEK